MYHFAMEHRLLWLGLLQCVLAAFASPARIYQIPKPQSSRTSRALDSQYFAPKPGRTEEKNNATVTSITPTVKAEPDFALKVSIRRSKQKHGHCSKRIINICASYNGSSGQTNMTIVEVKMQTGWIPVISDDIKNTTGLQRYEVDGNIVNFYFENFDAEQKCFSLDVEQTNILRDPKPAYVKIYAYNIPDSSVTKEYDMKTICGTKEELPFLTPEEYDRRLSMQPIMQLRVPSRHSDFGPKPGRTEKSENATVMTSITPTVKADPDFALKVSIRRSKQRQGHCSKRIINICASYNGSYRTKMAIVTVKMQSGWIPVFSDDIKNITGLQKYEVNGNIVNFYFENFDAEQKCFNLDVKQTNILRDPKPAYVKIYDNATDSSVTREYDMKTICGTKDELPFLTPEEYDRIPPFMQVRVPISHQDFAPMLEGTEKKENATVKNTLPEVKVEPDFALKVSIRRSKQKHGHCSKRIINICASYHGSSGQTNMTIVEVKMQNGWIPVFSDDIKNTTGLQKYEFDGKIVTFYFENFDAEWRCFNLHVEQQIKLTDPKPAYVKIYDYYETGSSVTKEYDMKTICGTKEELPFLTPEEYDRMPPFMQVRVPISHPDFAPKPAGNEKKENV